VFLAQSVDSDGADQHDVVGHMQTINLNDEEIELGQVAPEPSLHTFLRQGHEPTRRRRLRCSVTVNLTKPAFRQSHGTADLARRDPDQHEVHGRLAEPILVGRSRPTREEQLMTIAAANPRLDNIDLAAVVADLAPGSTPTMAVALWASRVPLTAHVVDIGCHHGLQGLDAGSETKPTETRIHCLPRLFHSRRDGERAN
jgi:hypothetical protein